LKEGDIPAAGDAAMGAQDAMGAADAAAGGAQLPPDVVQKIQALQAGINDLATSAGIQPAVDPTSADAAAGVPADPTAQPADPNAGAPMPESEKFDLEAAKKRIKEREAKLASLNEHQGVKEVAKNILADLPKTNLDMSGAQLSGGRPIATANPPSQGAGQATLAQAVNGSPSAAKTWSKGKEVAMPAAGKTSQSTNINESEVALDEKHVEKVLNEQKLNFKDLFKTGSILG
jgi:hypothetical protein